MSSVLSELTALIPVVVGASLIFLFDLIKSATTERSAAKRARQLARRTKLEHADLAFSRLSAWFDRNFDRLHTTSLSEFPWEFIREFESLVQTGGNSCLPIAKRYNEAFEKFVVATAELPSLPSLSEKEQREKVAEVVGLYKGFHAAKSELIKAVRLEIQELN